MKPIQAISAITALFDPHRAAAQREGWDLFEVGNDPVTLQVQRIDDPSDLPSDDAKLLPSDDAAMLIVRRGLGPHHAMARRILHDYFQDEWRALNRVTTQIAMAESAPAAGSLKRMWINQPSTIQPLRHLHGTIVLAAPDLQNTARVYFLSGTVISQQVPQHALSEGWLPVAEVAAPPPAAKFKVGDTVNVEHETGYKWQGVVEWVNNAGAEAFSSWEYRVSNGPAKGMSGQPLLLWENELTLAEPEFCTPNGTGECSCRKFGADPINCERLAESKQK